MSSKPEDGVVRNDDDVHQVNIRSRGANDGDDDDDINSVARHSLRTVIFFACACLLVSSHAILVTDQGGRAAFIEYETDDTIFFLADVSNSGFALACFANGTSSSSTTATSNKAVALTTLVTAVGVVLPCLCAVYLDADATTSAALKKSMTLAGLTVAALTCFFALLLATLAMMATGVDAGDGGTKSSLRWPWAMACTALIVVVVLLAWSIRRAVGVLGVQPTFSDDDVTVENDDDDDDEASGTSAAEMAMMEDQKKRQQQQDNKNEPIAEVDDDSHEPAAESTDQDEGEKTKERKTKKRGKGEGGENNAGRHAAAAAAATGNHHRQARGDDDDDDDDDVRPVSFYQTRSWLGTVLLVFVGTVGLTCASIVSFPWVESSSSSTGGGGGFVLPRFSSPLFGSTCVWSAAGVAGATAAASDSAAFANLPSCVSQRQSSSVANLPAINLGLNGMALCLALLLALGAVLGWSWCLVPVSAVACIMLLSSIGVTAKAAADCDAVRLGWALWLEVGSCIVWFAVGVTGALIQELPDVV